MPKTRRPSIRQELMVRELAQRILEGKPFTMKELALRSGYSPATAQQSTAITQTKTFQQLLNEYFPDNKLLDLWDALTQSKNENIVLGALKEITRLKDLYPAGKLRIGAFNERDKVVDE